MGAFHTLCSDCFPGPLIKCKSAHDPELILPYQQGMHFPTNYTLVMDTKGMQSLKHAGGVLNTHPKHCKAAGDSGTNNDRVALIFVWIMTLLNP